MLKVCQSNTVGLTEFKFAILGRLHSQTHKAVLVKYQRKIHFGQCAQSHFNGNIMG